MCFLLQFFFIKLRTSVGFIRSDGVMRASGVALSSTPAAPGEQAARAEGSAIKATMAAARAPRMRVVSLLATAAIPTALHVKMLSR